MTRQRAQRLAGWVAICFTIAVTLVALVGLALGHRPVVITTGSMGDAAPAGSLVIARPVDDSAVRVGDILVMQRPGQATVTHRVVELARENTAYVATTKGDANTVIDAASYPLGETELVERWTLPVLGSWLSSLSSGLLPIVLIIGLVAMATFTAVHSLWRKAPATTTTPPERVSAMTSTAGPGTFGTGEVSTGGSDGKRLPATASVHGPTRTAGSRMSHFTQIS